MCTLSSCFVNMFAWLNHSPRPLFSLRPIRPVQSYKIKAKSGHDSRGEAGYHSAMKPRDLFKLAVRILGLIFLYHGLMSVPVLFQGIYSSFRNAIGMIIAVGWPLVVAFALLGFADRFTDFFYPKSED
jgi:hypothetical protein